MEGRILSVFLVAVALLSGTCDAMGDGVEGRDVLSGLVKSGHGLCLDAPKREAAGSLLTLWVCDAANKNELWSHDQATGQLKNQFGLCVEAGEAPGADVVMGECDGDKAGQMWTVDAEQGRLEVSGGLCMSSKEKEGGHARVESCEASDFNQQMRFETEEMNHKADRTSDQVPQSCQVGVWTDFGQCSKQCAGGEQSRSRAVDLPPKSGGAACPKLIEKRKCNTQDCAAPVDCEVAEWTAYTTCTKSCGTGQELRTRTVTREPVNGGSSCPVLLETRKCNSELCPAPVDCELAPWAEWAQCSAECGGGTKTRARTMMKAPENGGNQCAALTETLTCGTTPCAADCLVSLWSLFSTCSVECGGGKQQRTRSVTTIPSGAGATCGELQEERQCGTHVSTHLLSMCLFTNWLFAVVFYSDALLAQPLERMVCL